MDVLITELGTWHDECLYTLCYSLHANGHRVVLAANAKTKSRLLEQGLQNVTDDIVTFNFSSSLAGMRELRRFRRYLLKGGFTHFHLNTAQGSLAWKLFLMPIPSRIKVTGTLHNIAKLSSSIGQRIITRRIDRYMLLSDILAPAYLATGCKVPYTVQYAVLADNSNHTSDTIMKPKDEIWLVVPGAVSFHRRDFSYLLQQNFPSDVRIIILGNINKEDGPAFRALVSELSEEQRSRYIFFESFVPNDVFDSYVRQCDALLPLVHPSNPELRKYVETKISGTYNLSVIHRKPMLCPESLRATGDMSDIALFYPDESLAEYLRTTTPSDISHNSANMFLSTKWTAEHQRQQAAELTS